MSNSYFKVTIEKLTFSKLWFSKFRKFASMSVFGEHNSQRYNGILKLLLEVCEQNCVWLFYYFNFERNHDCLKL